MAKFIYDLYYTDEGKVFKSINIEKMNELLQILLQETNRRSQEEKDKQLQLALIEDKENIEKHVKNANVMVKGQLNYSAEEYIPNNTYDNITDIKNNIYTYFTNHMDIDGFTHIESFCYKYKINWNLFMNIVKNDEYIEIKISKFKSHHPSTLKHIRSIISWTQNNIYKIFNDTNNYYYKFIKNNYLLIDHLLKDQEINKYFNYDTLKLIIKEDCRFGMNGNYIRTTI
jgi:hypothetical protein